MTGAWSGNSERDWSDSLESRAKKAHYREKELRPLGCELSARLRDRPDRMVGSSASASRGGGAE